MILCRLPYIELLLLMLTEGCYARLIERTRTRLIDKTRLIETRGGCFDPLVADEHPETNALLSMINGH